MICYSQEAIVRTIHRLFFLTEYVRVHYFGRERTVAPWLMVPLAQDAL